MGHTPGPWSADYGDFAAYCDTGAEVCEASAGIRDDGTRIPCEEMEANLNLIAAAPELLASLKQCLPLVDAYRRAFGGDGDVSAAYARSVIAKAEGTNEQTGRVD